MIENHSQNQKKTSKKKKAMAFFNVQTVKVKQASGSTG